MNLELLDTMGMSLEDAQGIHEKDVDNVMKGDIPAGFPVRIKTMPV